MTNSLPASLSDHVSMTGQNVFGALVAINASGTNVAAWSQNDGLGTRRVYASIYANGTWSGPSGFTDSLSTGGQNANISALSISDSGYILVTWQQSDGVALQVFKSDYYDGSWHKPSGLADNISFGSTTSNTSKIAVNSSGDAVIAWTQVNGGTNSTYKAERRAGTWTIPTALADNISTNQTMGTQDANVAMNDSGEAIIVWDAQDPVFNQIYKAEYRNSAWSIPSGDSDNISPDNRHATLPAVGMNNLGEAVVAWQQSNGSNTMLFKSEYYGGSWHNPSSLSDHISVAGQNVSGANPAFVGVSDSGDKVISWTQSDGTNTQNFIAEKRNGGSWRNPSSLSDNITPDGSAAGNPVGAINSTGVTYLFWQQDDANTISQGFYSEYRLGAWVHPTSLADSLTKATGNVNVTSTATNSSCHTVFAWRQNDGSTNQLYVGRRE
jgi:hypothetical protein